MDTDALIQEHTEETKLRGGIAGALIAGALAVTDQLATGYVSQALGDDPLLLGSVWFILAALGAFGGGWIERIYDRKVVAPRKAIVELASRLEKYEAGPRFVLDIVEPVTIAELVPIQSVVTFLFSVRCTNEGEPGRPFDWAAVVKFADGHEEPVHPLFAENISVSDGLDVKLNRKDMIWERTAVSLNRGDTAVGHFMGTMNRAAAARLGHDNWEMVLTCHDHRKRTFGYKYEAADEPDTRSRRQIVEPSLPPIVFNSQFYDKKLFRQSADDPPK